MGRDSSEWMEQRAMRNILEPDELEPEEQEPTFADGLARLGRALENVRELAARQGEK